MVDTADETVKETGGETPHDTPAHTPPRGLPERRIAPVNRTRNQVPEDWRWFAIALAAVLAAVILVWSL
jgi:hypothetical protein